MRPDTDVRWKMSDRGFRYYADAEGHTVHESSAADAPHLWIDGEHVPLDAARVMRDALAVGPFRDTLTAAIDGHYQTRPRSRWAGGDPCALCGSTDTSLVDDVASCNGCGVTEGS